MLHILVGGVCNNNCLFCVEADRESRAEHARAQNPADIRAMMDTRTDADGVLFTSGEPTFDPNLFTYLRWAKERGFREIGLISNGRRLAYPGFVDKLLDSGLNHVTISIHGHTAKLHDGLTRTPGSFEQTCAGLRNLCFVKTSRPFELRTSTVVTTRNLPHLERIYRFLADNSPIDLMVMNVMMAKGRGALHVDRLMPRYRDVVQAVSALCARLAPDEMDRLRIEDVPLCVSRELPRRVQGDLEEYRQYEALGSTGLSEVACVNPHSDDGSDDDGRNVMAPAADRISAMRLADDGAIKALPGRPNGDAPLVAFAESGGVSPAEARESLLEEVRRRISTPRLECDGRYYQTDRFFKDRFLRVKSRVCGECARFTSCPGVWEPYVRCFGWDEFVPVREGRDP